MMIPPTTKRILIVDDDRNIRLTLTKGLAGMHQDYQVDSAGSGSEALLKIKQTQYDLVITDYLMQGMSGLELAHKLQELAPQTTVVLMTAFGALSLQNLQGTDGIVAYLDKPIELNKIRALVKSVFDKTATTAGQSLPAAEPSQNTSIEAKLQEFRSQTNARLVILLDTSGHRVAAVGSSQAHTIDGICALIAASFMASAELARMLDNDAVFKTSHFAGPNYDIHAQHIQADFLLAVVFGSESKVGLVRFYATQLAEQLIPQLDFQPSDQHLFDEDFSRNVATELDALFSG
jgi:CheY-like chemotaxis protein/predicted regulator of Ras-like GTPase activity (Roadblock/LC7/MglB family)